MFHASSTTSERDAQETLLPGNDLEALGLSSYKERRYRLAGADELGRFGKGASGTVFLNESTTRT